MQSYTRNTSLPKLSCNLTIEPLLIHREGKPSECYVNILIQSEPVRPQGSKVRREFLLLHLLASYIMLPSSQQESDLQSWEVSQPPLSLSLSLCI